MPRFNTSQTFLPYVLALLSGGIWGLTFSLARIATESAEEPLGLALWQSLGGAIVLSIYCLLRRIPVSFNRTFFKHCFVVGLFGSALPGTLFFYAAPHIASGVLAITVALVPILTFALSLALGSERFSAVRFVGIVLGFGAILLIMLPGSSSVGIEDSTAASSAMASQIWLALALIATLAYTIENIYVDRYVGSDVTLATLLVGSFVMAVLLLLPLVWYNQAFVTLTLPLDRLDGVLILMAIVSSIAYLMFLLLIKLAGPVFASLSGYVVTLSGVFWGMALFDESHSGWIWFALFLMVFGLVLVTPKERPQELGKL